MKRTKRNRGQAIIEYVLIIAIVVVASVAVLGIFSDTVRQKVAGIIHVFDPDQQVDPIDVGSSQQILEDLDQDGLTQ